MLRSVGTLLAMLTLASCVVDEEQRLNDPRFPLEPHLILPVWFPSNGGQIAAGVATGEALEQPVPFSHWLHATKNETACEYCHTAARNGPHGGVPELQTCMNCHSRVKTNSPYIKQLTDAYEAGTPIAWQKVHDLPDYVVFTHNRHVRAGVNCTDCHGQVQLQGKPELIEMDGVDGTKIEVNHTDEVMVREATLQMGWCLDCHANHESVDENYGDKADLRRAELKDCWTCHK